MRSPKSPKQLPVATKRFFPWQTQEQIALVQFVALFCDLKPEGTEWPTFGNRHEYWNKAAVFVQETTGTEYLRSGESNNDLLFVQASQLLFESFFLIINMHLCGLFIRLSSQYFC